VQHPTRKHHLNFKCVIFSLIIFAAKFNAFFASRVMNNLILHVFVQTLRFFVLISRRCMDTCTKGAVDLVAGRETLCVRSHGYVLIIYIRQGAYDKAAL
jgi:hypothetical protein